MVDIIKYSAVLATVSCLAVLPVSFIHSKTARQAASQWNNLVDTALRRVAPEGATIDGKSLYLQTDGDSVAYWLASTATDTTYCFTVETFVYPGSSTFVVGIGVDGIVKGMCSVGGAGPGCRDAVRTGAPSAKKDGNDGVWFTMQFVGLSAIRPITVNNAVDEWPLLDEARRSALRAKNQIAAAPGAAATTGDIATAVTIQARRLLAAIRS